MPLSSPAAGAAGDFSVLILTLNEERNLPDCLASVAGCADLVVLDSGSTDRTRSIAEQAGARFFSRPFDDFAQQRNYAQREIRFRHPWVFHLDADERMTPELLAACRGNATRTDVEGFFVAPKMLWHGRWLPRCTDFPAWQARFVRAPEFRFIQVGHGQREAAAMRMDTLTASYLHELCPGSETEWLAKHRGYAHIEAQHALATALPSWKTLFSGEALVRRRALKSFATRLPARSLARFIYQYVVRRGFLDGAGAARFCYLLARADGFLADELRQQRRAAHSRS